MPSETTQRVSLHYRQLGLWYGRGKKDGYQGWTRDRFNRLCHMLNVTQDELAALVCVPMWKLAPWLKANNIPPEVSLHFEIMEASYIWATSGHSRIVMPNHLICRKSPAPHQD
jgi:hypothetical protein